jgi:uncharacterized protein YutE (UPF0331/DUF86 family)
VAAVKVEPGQSRGPGDGSRRYTPVDAHFDTRARVLETKIEPDWEPQIQEQWRRNQAGIREMLVHEYGAHDYERKIADFTELGAVPWSVVALHNAYLAQARAAFATGNYYPALLGACGLGERILNQLVLALREDFTAHPATSAVAGKESFDNWRVCIRVLKEWGVFDDGVAGDFALLMRHRHAAVHYRSALDSGDARQSALEALVLLSGVVERVFEPHGDHPYYFTGPIGRSYVRLEAEAEPFVKRFILPACVLVSPVYRFVPTAGGLDVYDDDAFGVASQRLTDVEFADPKRATPQVPPPF